MGREDRSGNLLRIVAKRRAKKIAEENPRLTVTAETEVDRTQGMESIILTLREDDEVRGFEFIEDGTTFITKLRSRIYVDMLRRGYRIGILIPEGTDLLTVLKVHFPTPRDGKPSLFVYDEEGNIKDIDLSARS